MLTQIARRKIALRLHVDVDCYCLRGDTQHCFHTHHTHGRIRNRKKEILGNSSIETKTARKKNREQSLGKIIYKSFTNLYYCMRILLLIYLNHLIISNIFKSLLSFKSENCRRKHFVSLSQVKLIDSMK